MPSFDSDFINRLHHDQRVQDALKDRHPDAHDLQMLREEDQRLTDSIRLLGSQGTADLALRTRIRLKLAYHDLLGGAK